MNCVVLPHRAGLFSNINKVVTCLRMYEQVGVDWSSGSLYGDCWNDLFEPRPRPSEPVELVSEYPFYDITAACAGVLYQNIGWGWRDRFNREWKKLGVRPDVVFDADQLFADRQDVVAVQIRPNAHAGEQIFGKIQSLDDYALALERTVCPDTKVFVMSSDEESLDWMCRRFSCFFDPSVLRGKKRDLPEPHLEIPQTKDDARRCLVEVIVASKCRALVHPISNMSTAALYINPTMQSVYLK